MKAQLRRWNRVDQLEVHLLREDVKQIIIIIVQGVLESFQDLPAWFSSFRAQPVCLNIVRFDDDGRFWLARKVEDC